MILLLWCLHFFLETSAKDVVETLYRMKGQSVCLGPGDAPPPYDNAKWSNGKKIIISSNKMNPDFEKTMDYYNSSAMLCINKLTEKDNGNYTLTYEQNFSERDKKYELIAKDAVPTPSLSVTMEQVNVSVGFCVFAVNCSVQHHFLCSECDRDACRPAHRSFSELNITVSIGNGKLTCTGNNLVSSKAASQETETLCLIPEPEASSSVTNDLVWILGAAAIFAVAFVLFCFGAKTFISTRRKKQPQVIPSQPLERHSEQRVSTSSTQAEASYENVDPINMDRNTDQNTDQEEHDVNTHTVYCVLEPLPPSDCDEMTSETSEERRGSDPLGVHTVYSVIQRHAV